MPHDASSSYRSLIAGGFGGVCDVLIAYPLDLVTVRLQTAPKGTYSGPLDVARQAIKAHGSVRGLYNGVSAPLFGIAPMYALSFWAYDLGQKLVRSFHPSMSPSSPLNMSQTAIAGAISSAPFVVIGIPFDRAKIVLNLQAQSARGTSAQAYSGTIDVLSSLLRHHGIAELYRGLTITLMRDIPAGAAYFVTYEGLRRALGAETTSGPKWPIYMAAGSAAHVAMIASIFPFDTIKTRIQGAGMEHSGQLLGEVRNLWKAGGLRAFYPGLAPAVIREIPAGAVTFLGYELAMSALGAVSVDDE